MTTETNTPSGRVSLALQYFLYFGTLGMFLPFFNLYCYHLNFSGLQIGTLSSIQTGATVIFPLIWGALADRLKARKFIYILCNLAGAGLWSLFLLTTDFYPMLIITLFYSIFRAPVISFMEAFSMDILGPERNSYGRVRAWGTASFIAVVIAMGRITDIFSINIIIPLILAGTLLQSIGALALPDARRRSEKSGAKSLMGQKRVGMFLLCAFLMLVSHGTYYGFFSIHLEDLGFDATFIGIAWALASLAEIVVMLASARLFARFSLESVLIFSFFAACARWLLTAVAVTGPMILACQILHAATYAAFHMASILYMDRVSPEGAKTLGQAINNAVSFGLGMMVGIFGNGIFYDNTGARPLFVASAVLALAGGLLMAATTRLAARKDNAAARGARQ
ncbi:MAG: MFS transporter [Thermodesulfobacteriota bacterium]